MMLKNQVSTDAVKDAQNTNLQFSLTLFKNGGGVQTQVKKPAEFVKA